MSLDALNANARKMAATATTEKELVTALRLAGLLRRHDDPRNAPRCPKGIVGYVTGFGETRVVEDVTSDIVYFANPDLPETQAEIALPLRARGEIIGALDVQSSEPMAFPPEKITILQTLADQIATAIDNARLFSETQAALETTRKAYGEITRAVWDDLIRTQSDRGVVAILDRRVRSKQYGQLFLQSLPNCHLVESTIEDLPEACTRWLNL